MFNIIFRIERWKWNKQLNRWISTEGRIKDKDKQLIKPKVDGKGYLKVPGTSMSLHRAVLCTWKPIENSESMTVDHLNHNKRDNSLANLEWVTAEENTRRGAEDLEQTILMTSWTHIKDSLPKIKYDTTPPTVLKSYPREELIDAGYIKPSADDVTPRQIPVVDPKTYIINEGAPNMASRVKSIRKFYNDVNDRCVKELNLSKNDRKNSCLVGLGQPKHFNKTTPIVMLVQTGGEARYFKNYDELETYVLNNMHKFPTFKKVANGYSPKKVLEGVAEATLFRQLTMSAGIYMHYVGENFVS